jgi:nicotinamide-nucleotide amidase
MRIFLVNTGTELLLGDVRDAHLSFIAQQILELGLRIEEQRTVPDGPAIQTALADIFRKCDLIFVTGGLGPTSDDITRDLAAELLELRLIQDEDVLHSIRQRLRKRSIEITEPILRQANVPEGAQVLPNRFGTAPGLFLHGNINPRMPSPHLFLLPGPPRELQPMFTEFAMPIVRSLLERPETVKRKLYKIANMGESVVETMVGAKLLATPGLEVGYCARPGEVDLRIIGESGPIEAAHVIIMESLGKSVFTMGDETLEQVIVRRLTAQGKSLSIAESCTGGLLAHRITNVPGASEVFLAGYITYSNAAKTDVLGIEQGLLEEHGAVSAEVACAMAENARKRSDSSLSLATTGIAGPGGGSDAKPVGTVFIGIARPDAIAEAHRFFFPSDRETFKQMVAQAAFELLRKELG